MSKCLQQIDSANTVLNLNQLDQITPENLDVYVDATYYNILSAHDIKLFKSMLRDRWYKGEILQLKEMLNLSDPVDLKKLVCNAINDKSLKDQYIHGEHINGPLSSKLTRSVEDFKKPVSDSQLNKTKEKCEEFKNGVRGWYDDSLERLFASFSSLSSIIKHKSEEKFIVLELLPSKSQELKSCLSDFGWHLIFNKYTTNICAVRITGHGSSQCYILQLAQLIKDKYVTVLFCTDINSYLKHEKQSLLDCNCNEVSYDGSRNCRDMIINFSSVSEIAESGDDNCHLNSDSVSLEMSKDTLNEIVESGTQQKGSVLSNQPFLFYLYNAIKFRYYCLCNKFIFVSNDYHIICLLKTIALLEWNNKTLLSSLTLEKSTQNEL